MEEEGKISRPVSRLRPLITLRRTMFPSDRNLAGIGTVAKLYCLFEGNRSPLINRVRQRSTQLICIRSASTIHPDCQRSIPLPLMSKYNRRFLSSANHWILINRETRNVPSRVTIFPIVPRNSTGLGKRVLSLAGMCVFESTLPSSPPPPDAEEREDIQRTFIDT